MLHSTLVTLPFHSDGPALTDDLNAWEPSRPATGLGSTAVPASSIGGA